MVTTKIKTDWLWFIALAGVVIFFTMQPSKTTIEKEKTIIIEEYESKIQELTKTNLEEKSKLQEQIAIEQREYKLQESKMTQKIEQLYSENYSLKQSSKKQKIRIVRPDGTIIEKELEEFNKEEMNSIVVAVREEFVTKTKTIEERWKKVHIERIEELKKQHNEDIQRIISEHKTVEKIIEKEKIVEVNKKKLRPELGISYNDGEMAAYFHASYSVYGPIFLGGGFSGTKNNFGDLRLGVGLDL